VSRGDRSRPVILTVDDELVIRESFRDFLEDHDYTVLEARDGAEGLRVFNEASPDLVLADIRMPVVDGLEVLRQITKLSPETPVIAVSGTGVIFDVVEALRLGAWDFIIKPVLDLDILGHAIERSLVRARLARENRTYIENLRETTVSRDELVKEVERRKLVEEELERRVQDVSAVNRALEEFAYAASHDLKEPLRTIASYTQLLEKKIKNKVDEEAGLYMGFVVNAAIRMDKLIGGILRYLSISSFDEPFFCISSEQAVTAAIHNLNYTIRANGAKVTYGPMPGVFADKVQLTELFQNLIGNAVKFHRERVPPEVEIQANLLTDTGEWLFSVRDNGIGIKRKHFDRIFSIFKRLHTQEKFLGTGIGLPICKSIVERHGGRIWLESEEGRGTIFFFTVKDGGEKRP
ncbi:MAG: response regulator, partial [Nitrospinota bacterium]